MRIWLAVLFVVVFIIGSLYGFVNLNKETVKIGLLYSKTGTMAVSEQAIAETLKLQVNLANAKGGVLNQQIEIIEYDGASNDLDFAKGARHLTSLGIKTIFGCWTSASRKAVKPIIEENDALLFYPVQYEGVEQSKNIVYLGSPPNQQINPIISYIRDNYGKKIYVVGSNYIYPRLTGIYLSEMAQLVGLNILEQAYLPLGENDFQQVIEQILKLKPDAIINTLNGESNLSFFKAMQQAGLNAKTTPVFSTSIDERTVDSINKQLTSNPLEGHFIAGSYFHSIQTDDNKQLIATYQQNYHSDFLLTDASYNTHLAFQFWLRAVDNSETTQPDELLKALQGDSLRSASGIIYLDPKNNHLHKAMRIARIENNLPQVIWSSNVLSSPLPFPVFKDRSFWQAHQTELFESWGQRWEASEKFIIRGAYE